MKNTLWNEVVDLLEQQGGQTHSSDVLSVLLTAEESRTIGSRLAILRALLTGTEAQRKIASRLGVSIAKVTRCSHYLKTLSRTEKQLITG